MLCVGPKGLPDDVKAVSISQSARDSNRPESEIVKRLQENGYLLLTEEAFSLLIERLVDSVRMGKLHLPVSRDKLMDFAGVVRPKPSIDIIEVK